MRESQVKLAATSYLLSGTPYRYNVAKLRVPGLSYGRGGNQADAVDLPVYLGRWLVGAVECKKSWSAQDNSGNNGWGLIYKAIGQLMFHGRAPTILGQHPDVDPHAYRILLRLWRRQKFNIPDLPLAAVVGSQLDDSNRPQLNARESVENTIRTRLRTIGVHLILCWRKEERLHLEPEARSSFLSHVDEYASEVEAKMAELQQSCEATVSLLHRLTAASYASIEGDDRAATFALDIADAYPFFQNFYGYEPPRNQEWDVAKLQALAKDFGGDDMLRDIISRADELREHARRRY